MSTRDLTDINLRCASCGDGFVFSAGEQELFRLRGVTLQPQQCPSCARPQAKPHIKASDQR